MGTYALKVDRKKNKASKKPLPKNKHKDKGKHLLIYGAHQVKELGLIHSKKSAT